MTDQQRETSRARRRRKAVEYTQRYRARHPDRIAAWWRTYYRKHRAKRLAAAARQRLERKARILAERLHRCAA